MCSEEQSTKVLMFPWLAHGHISPTLELAKGLSDRNFTIHICSTPANLSSIKNKIIEKYTMSIQLVELHLPSFPDLPPQNHTTNGLPRHLISTLKTAFKMAKPDLLKLLRTLQPDLLIYDCVVPWAGSVASRHNIPAIEFYPSGAIAYSYLCHLGLRPGIPFPFPAIRLTDFECSIAYSLMKSLETVAEDPDDAFTDDRIVLVNSSRELEGKYMDYMPKIINMKLISIGALIGDPHVVSGGYDSYELLDWLGKKDEFSTVFVSVGTEYFLEKEEIQEIAYGLELSGANFIWVIRFPTGEEMEIEEVLPEGFLERVGERGRVVEKWAPQAQILRHPSIGGFVSHCGWNSVIESIHCGVPIIAMPMHLEQPITAKLVVELGVGLEVARDERGRFQREEISNVIRDVVNGKSGPGLRKNVEELRENIRSRTGEEMDEAAQMLVNICGKISR